MGRRADITQAVVEHQVFEMHELAVDPQRGAGIGELRPFEEARADRRAGNALVETGERSACGFYLRASNQKLSYQR